VDETLLFITEILPLLSTAADRFRKYHCHTAVRNIEVHSEEHSNREGGEKKNINNKYVRRMEKKIGERNWGRKNIEEICYFEGLSSSDKEAVDENQLCKDEKSCKDVNIFSYRINTNDIRFFCGDFGCSGGCGTAAFIFRNGSAECLLANNAVIFK
jgi:hypothetical protein